MFPTRYAWTQTFKTSISAFGSLGIYWALEIWRFVLWFMVFRSVEPRIALLPAILICTLIPVSFLWFNLVLIIYRWILALLWSSPPSWMRVGNRGSILKAWLIMVFATLPSATISFWSIRVLEIPARQSLWQFFEETHPTKNLILFAVLWGIFAVYLFHWFSPNHRKSPAALRP